MEEPQITIPPSRAPDPDSVANREFPLVRRGFDPALVKRFLGEIGQHLRALRARESELTNRLADAERRAQSPSFDEETLSQAVGSETARILHAAHAAGAEVLAKAEARAGQIVIDAEASVREVRGRAEAEASTIMADARQAAANAMEIARADGRAMVEEARELRRKILGDLTERRRALAAQIEQLQAGKDSLYSAVAHVADAIADVRERLGASDEEARSAAEGARHRSEADQPAGGPERPAALSTAATEGLETAARARSSAPHSAEAGEVEEAEVIEAAAGGGSPAREAAENEMVDELFAKLRAARVEEERPTAPARHRRQHARKEELGEPVPEAASAGAHEGEITEADASEEGTGVDDAAAADRADVLRKRDAMFEAPQGELVHELKRALRVEQNDLLDRLRSLRRGTNPVEVISIEDSAKGLSEATTPGLTAAFKAGVRFATQRIGPRAETIASGQLDATAHAAALGDADRLGGEIASAIARRLEDALRPGAPESGSYQNAVGAVYRDWKGERVEDVATDYAISAFSEGVMTVAQQSGAGISWVADDGTLRCSDCEDDELAGVVPVGTPFPTGQIHPPAHGGCRCVVVPATR
jgi:cell division septum initiation protein DivIVA